MLDHISFGVSELGRSRAFYDAALQPLGFRCLSSGDAALGYGKSKVDFWVLAATRPVPADDASGLHVCFTARSRSAVDAFHAAGIAAGGRSNGAPGLRPDYGDDYYAAFLTDPDGYRVEAYCGAGA